MGRTENILLIRHPADMLRSLTKVFPTCGIEDTGLPEQVDLLERALAAGSTPVVVDSQVLLRDPPAVLASLCDRVGLPFDEAMLSWPAGPKPYDGVWAPVWYANVHASTGFTPPRPPADEAFPAELQPVLDEALPLYDRLAAYA